ncbi:MAG: mannosyltransferase family protein [Acidobacteriota bacterium]
MTPLPRWARALDAIALLCLALAGSVLIGGSLRAWFLVGRVSVTGAERPLVVAVLALLVRHGLRRHPVLPVALWHGVAAWWRDPATRAALPIFVATRAGVMAIGLLAIIAFGYASPDGPPYRLYESDALNLPARWDAGWYIGIAIGGYEFAPDRWQLQQNIAFFPGYPMAIRYARLFLAGQTLWAGVAVSLVAFFAALVYLYRLARTLMDEERANLALALASAYPFAVFYSAPYSEGLFLLASVAAWYHFREDRLVPAAVWGLLAGLSRPNGAFLSVPFALMVIWPLVTSGAASHGAGGRRRLADRLAVAAMPGLGMLVYSAFVFDLTGDWFAWAKLHGAWGRAYQGLDTLVARELASFATAGLYGVMSTRLTDFLNLLGVLFALGCTWGVWRRLGAPMAVYIVITVLPPLANGGLLSMGRVTSILFPCFLWLAATLPPTHRSAWVIGFAALQAFVAALFFTWRPLF